MIQTTLKRKYSYYTFSITIVDNVFQKGDIIQNMRTMEKTQIKSVPPGRGGYFVWRNYPSFVISSELEGRAGDVIRKVG